MSIGSRQFLKLPRCLACQLPGTNSVSPIRPGVPDFLLGTVNHLEPCADLKRFRVTELLPIGI